MTKEEFIQQAALRLLGTGNGLTLEEMAEMAKEYAGYIYPEKEVIDESDDLKKLFEEIDRIDEARLFSKEWGNSQMCGYAVRIRRACDRNEIRSVDDLVKFGSKKFAKNQTIGKLSIDVISEALNNLYSIKKW